MLGQTIKRFYSTPITPQLYTMLRYTYVDGMLEKRGPYREGHLKLLQEASDKGLVSLGGAFADPCDGGK